MRIDKAVNRLTWRFKKFDKITINAKDIDALNAVVRYINNLQVKHHPLHPYFVKLYVAMLKVYMDKYDTNIDNNLIHNKLHSLLRTPVPYLIEDLTSHMNSRLQCKLLEAAECDMSKHPLMHTPESKEHSRIKLQELLKNGNNKKIFYGNAWSTQEVKLGLNNQINTFLNGI